MKLLIRVVLFTMLVALVWTQEDMDNFGFNEMSRCLKWGGPVYVMQYEGDNLFAIFGNTLGIFDMSTPADPEQISSIRVTGGLNNEPLRHTMEIQGAVCQVSSTDDEGFVYQTVIDVSNLSAPSILHQQSFEIEGHLRDAVIKDKYIFYHGRYDGDNINILYIDSLTDDGDIIEISHLKMTKEFNVGSWAGERLMLRSYVNSCIYFLDVSDKYDPVLSDSIFVNSLSYTSSNVCGDYLFLSDESDSSKIIDISQPGNFKTLYSRPSPFYYRYPTVKGNLLYTIISKSDTTTFEVIDLSDPSNPITLSSTFLRPGWGSGPMILYSGISGLAVGPDHAFINGSFHEKTVLDDGTSLTHSFENGLKVIDLTDIANPITHEAISGRAWHMGLSDHGLWLFGNPWVLMDVENTSLPIPRGQVDPLPSDHWISFEDNLMYTMVVEGETNEKVSVNVSSYNVTNPLIPDLKGFIKLDSLQQWNRSFVVKNSIVYLSCGDTLYTIDFTFPVQPELTSKLYTGQLEILRVSESDAFIYGVTDDDRTLTIIDVSSPKEPQLAGEFTSDAWAYVADGDIGFSLGSSENHDGGLLLQRLDLSDPQNITKMGNFLSGYGMYTNNGLILDGSFLYVCSLGAVEVFDISIPGQETKVGRYETAVSWPAMFFLGYGIRDIAVEDGVVYLLHDLDGLHILKHSTVTRLIDEVSNAPSVFKLCQNYPNPFNPTTTISYSLPEAEQVKLSIFDIQGKEVLILLNTEKPPGTYEVLWNGTNGQGGQVSTGVYFARLQAGEYSHTIKMLYLK